MDTEVLVNLLEHHFTQAQHAQEVYKIRLRRTIDRLKAGFYLHREDQLVSDLQSLGFADIVQQIRRKVYL